MSPPSLKHIFSTRMAKTNVSCIQMVNWNAQRRVSVKVWEGLLDWFRSYAAARECTSRLDLWHHDPKPKDQLGVSKESICESLRKIAWLNQELCYRQDKWSLRLTWPWPLTPWPQNLLVNQEAHREVSVTVWENLVDLIKGTQFCWEHGKCF